MSRRNVVSAVLTVATVALAAYFVIREGSVEAVENLDARMLVALLATSSVSLVMRGTQLSNVARPFGVRVPLDEAIGLSALNTLSNYLPARAGIVIRGAYLREFHGLSIVDYTAMTALWFVGSIPGALAVGAMTALSGFVPVARLGVVGVFLVLTALLVGGFVVLERAVSLSNPSGRIGGTAARIHRGILLWRQPGSWRWWFAVWSAGSVLVGGLRFWLALEAVGAGANLASAIVIQAFLATSLLVAVTPGNIGIREGMAVFAASLAGVDPDVALVAAVIDRAVILLPAIAGAAFLGRPLVTRLRSRKDAAVDRTDDGGLGLDEP